MPPSNSSSPVAAYPCSAPANTLPGPKAVADLDDHEVGRPHRFLALGPVTVDDRLQPQVLPKPQCQSDLTAAATVGPADRALGAACDVPIVGRRDRIVVGAKAELVGGSLAMVPEVSDAVRPGPWGGTRALDQGRGGVGLAILGTGGAAPEDTGWPLTRMVRGRPEIKELGCRSVFTTVI